MNTVQDQLDALSARLEVLETRHREEDADRREAAQAVMDLANANPLDSIGE
jgi:hypothetical protein